MGFMEAVHGLQPGPLDLILHSPGGDANAVQAIMQYLRDLGFGPIRAIVPLSAMSAATMMALCCDEILMARHAQLGPMDPQFQLATPDGPRVAPAQAILEQFDAAKLDCAATPSNLAAWLPILRSYLPGLLSQCLTAQEAAEHMVAEAMQKYMFAALSEGERKAKAEEIAGWFNDHKTHRSHGRPLRYPDIQPRGVAVHLLEDDQVLQDKVLSAWHGIQLTLSQIAIGKLIENHAGRAWMISASPVLQVALGIQSGPPTTPPGATTPPALPAGGGAQGINRAERRRRDRGR